MGLRPEGETMMRTLYARKVPTNDALAFQYCEPTFVAKLNDVEVSESPDFSTIKVRYNWTNAPDYRHRRVMLNCWPWRLEWVKR